MAKHGPQDDVKPTPEGIKAEINGRPPEPAKPSPDRPEHALSEAEGPVEGQARLQELETRVADLTADLKRVQADFINYRRRSDQERGEFISLAKRDVVLQLLPLLDNLDRALSHLPESLQDDAWAKGVAQLAKQGTDILKSLDVERIESVGQDFDPNLHEAISYDDGDGDRQVVVEELQPGYRLGGRVIRHAVVKVGHK